MRKKIIIIVCIVIVLIVCFCVLVVAGIINLETIGSGDEIIKETSVVEELEDNYYYVLNHVNSNIKNQVGEEQQKSVFRICPQGVINWNENVNVAHTIWFTSSNDYEIPTLYPGDQLVYVSKNAVPSEGIKWERYADYGYTIGVTNLQKAESGHYRIILDMENGYSGYLNFESDTAPLSIYTNVTELYIDKIGNVPIRGNMVSDGGTILGLEKNRNYLCEWYTGTYYQDYEMKAENHTFCIIEEFTTYEYEFLHSRAIAITIPEWFKSGYYYVGGMGLFRYVNIEDLSLYNGLAYDSNVNWNDPIILYDDNGFLIYDPANGLDKRNEENMLNNININQSEIYESNVTTDIIPDSEDYHFEFSTDDITTGEEGDAVEAYEDFFEEHYIE